MSVLSFEQFITERYNGGSTKSIATVKIPVKSARTQVNEMKDIKGIFKKRVLADLNYNKIAEKLNRKAGECKSYIVEAEDKFMSAKVIAPNENIAKKLWEAKFITGDWSSIVNEKALNESVETMPKCMESICEEEE